MLLCTVRSTLGYSCPLQTRFCLRRCNAVASNMPKNQTSRVYGYFCLEPGDTAYRCLVANEEDNACGETFSTSESYNVCANLKRHLKRNHVEKWKVVQIADEKEQQTAKKRKVEPANLQPITAHFKPLSLKVTMTKETFKSGLVQMAINGAPLRMFEGKGFSTLNGEMAGKLGVGLSRESIRSYIMEAARNVEENLKLELSGKLLFIKTDAATRRLRNFLGVNVQYYDEKTKTSKVKTLALVDTARDHTSLNMKCLLEATFSRFGILKENILCLVVDNASNMTKTVERLNEENDIAEEEVESQDEEDDITPSTGTTLNIHHMRCAAHTLQLAVRDGLRLPRSTRLLTKVRAIVHKLRTPNILTVLEKRTKRRPILDTPTRWGSTFLMLKRLLELKDNVQDLGAASPDLHLSEMEWGELLSLNDLLQAPYNTTIRIQKEKLTAGEFMKQWCSLKRSLRLRQEGLPVSRDIVGSMEERERLLFANDLFLAAVFVDPRYRLLLSTDQCNSARKGIKEVVMKLANLVPVPVATMNTENDTSPNSSTTEDDEFERELDELEMRRAHADGDEQTNAAQILMSDLDRTIENMLDKGRLKCSSVWEVLDSFDEPLKGASKVLSSIPVTQVSVERLFSSMRFVLSDLRLSMKQDLLEALLLLRTNDEN